MSELLGEGTFMPMNTILRLQRLELR